ncbi:APA family basic amino acid/polyamine antiporter [Diaminobutyricimonas aerilata]|uniref:APA family basic amino acid/polyamine antiporter n=1 Tax=Diaminobutyricimonas aerilata TaxID=1162967 RepID=A0A2M9CHS3_9MICO|nr:APC family permease [Diaminobutyricimonas aerilata]PJJ71437.1 APA family basic amino acid/polyamine antiporter [Diaminobutyricimonas aerilata]
MQQLVRRLGVVRATTVGLAAMVGAGVFVVWGPAADAAGSLLLVSLGIAALVAALNALSTTQLAVAHPVAGGAYAYGRAVVGPRTGFTAGWLFLWGKTASAAAIALTAGQYLWPEAARIVAVAVVVVLAIVNASGIRSTATVGAVVVSIVLVGIAAAVLAAVPRIGDAPPAEPGNALGVLQGAALVFFAFAGYARMATLSEEVREPRRTLPRAILTAFVVAVTVYAVVAAVCLAVLGVDRLAASTSPLADAAGEGWRPVIAIVAGIACLGSLAGVLAGLSRTGLAMARDRELPGPLATIWARTGAPAVAEVTFAVLAIAGVLLLPSGMLVALSSCAVLGYYAIAHVAALRQPRPERWVPRFVPAVGLAACLLLLLSVPPLALAATALILLVGHTQRELRARLAR